VKLKLVLPMKESVCLVVTDVLIVLMIDFVMNVWVLKNFPLKTQVCVLLIVNIFQIISVKDNISISIMQLWEVFAKNNQVIVP